MPLPAARVMNEAGSVLFFDVDCAREKFNVKNVNVTRWLWLCDGRGASQGVMKILPVFTYIFRN
jgi:hypothetical protein